MIPRTRDEEHDALSQYEPIVRRYIRKRGWYLRNGSEDDLVNEGLVAIWRAWASYTPEKGDLHPYLMAWVRLVLSQLISKQFRKRPQFTALEVNGEQAGEEGQSSHWDVHAYSDRTLHPLEGQDPSLLVEYHDLAKRFETYRAQTFTKREQTVFALYVGEGLVSLRHDLPAYKRAESTLTRIRRKMKVFHEQESSPTPKRIMPPK